jgi:glycerophosphoryl diester phosphodiesterase
MIAHTGYSAVAPGNTIPAYIAAGESDFWGAECDIQRTKDGVWVLMHDDTVDRTTDGTGKVTELTYAEILEFNVDDGNNIEKYPGLKVPRFEDYLDVCKEYGLHPVIEVKPNADPAYMEELTAILSSREEKDMFYVICFNRELCVRIKELMPSLRVYYLIGFENVFQEDIDFAVSNHLDGMDIHVFLPDDYVNAVTASGLDVFVWTIDDLDNAERFYKLGVNAITTNSLTQEKPDGNIFQKIIWFFRDFFYKIKMSFKTSIEKIKS